MKHTVHIAPGVGFVHNTLDAEPSLLADRIANGEAFPGEQRIRLPRRRKSWPGPEWTGDVAGRTICARDVFGV